MHQIQRQLALQLYRRMGLRLLLKVFGRVGFAHRWAKPTLREGVTNLTVVTIAMGWLAIQTFAQTTKPTTEPTEDHAAMLQSAFALEKQAYITQLESDYRAAAEALEKCAQLEPDNVNVQHSLGVLWLDKLNDAAEAYPHLERAYALTPTEHGWGYLLAKDAGELGRTDRQIQVLREVLKRDPNDADAQTALTKALGDAAASQPATTQPATTTAATQPDERTTLLQTALALETTAYTTQTAADYKAAAEAFEKYSHLDPANVQVERSVGFLWLDKLNDPARAYPHLEKAWSLSPDESDWGYLLAKAAGKIGNTDRQIQVLREVLKRDPANSVARSALAEALGPATTQATTAPVDRAALLHAAFALQTQAYTTQSTADYKAAAEALDQCSIANPGNIQVERSVGFLWLDKLNDAGRAYPHLEKAYTLSPNESDWAFLLARAAGEIGKTDRQVEVLSQILKCDPDNADARNALAALTTTQPATAPTPQSQHASFLQAAFALETQAYTTDSKADYQAAADALEKCSKLEPENLQVQRSVGFLWLDKLKDASRAYPHLEKAYALSPDDAGWGSLLAKAAGETGHGDRQLAVLRDVVKRNPDNASAHLELAQALDKASQHDQAGGEFQAAMKLAPDDESIIVAYGQFLHARGRDVEASHLADKVLAKNPKSAGALALKGDVHRNDWDLDEAQASYQQALALDPESEVAKTGMSEIRHNKAPTFDSSYYYFKGNDKFMQQGLYDTLSLSASDHIYVNATYNMGYFKDTATTDPSVIRYQEGVGIEDRIASAVSIRGGVEGFQQPKKEAFGYNLGVTWKPLNELWFDVTYRTADPVNDSMFTVSNGLSQDILGATGGWQITDDLALKFAASRSVYSDSNVREYIHLEPAYTIWQAMKLRIGAEYETVKYSVQIPGAGSVNWYQTYGPVVEIEPSITDWFSLHARAEFPYVEQARQWGSNLSFDLSFHPGEHLTIKAGAFYVSVPESISSYSGSGFDASISYRF